MMKIVLVLMVLLLIDKIQRQNKDFFVLNHRFKIIWFGDAIWGKYNLLTNKKKKFLKLKKKEILSI
jgi:hypothetical protein